MQLSSAAVLFGSLVFGLIGMAAFVYGKKTVQFKKMLLGIGLMVYPYFISQTWLLYAMGAGLTVSLFLFQD